MKSLFALLVLLSGLAQAAEVKVYETSKDPWSNVIQGSFEVNPDMDRAWVSVVVADRLHGRDSQRSYADVKVPGLFYDAATRQVMLQLDGQLIECGVQRGNNVFTRRIVKTGCSFEARTERRVYDDGYRTYNREYLQLFLVTK